MIPDPVAEIKRIRHELGAEMDFDVHRIFDDLRRREATSGRSYVRRPARRIADNQSLDQSRRSGPSEMER
jgi:hypothetical protein